MSQLPWEMFDQDQWDGSHSKPVVQLAQQQAWKAMKHYIEWMGDTYLREHMQLIVQLASPRLYHTLWGENDALWGEHDANVKKGAPDLKENPV